MEASKEEQKSGAPATVPVPTFQPPKKKRKWVKRVIVVIILVAVAVFVLKSCFGGAVTGGVGSYLTDTVVRQDLDVAVSGTGTIRPIDSYQVTSMVKGEVLEAPFEEGETVGKDALLFRLDSKDVETSIQQARLSVQSARLNYEQLLKNQKTSSENREIVAVASGVITKLYVEAGDDVMTGSPIADILDRDSMKLALPFHAVDAAGITVGQSATVMVDGTLEKLIGTVDAIAATDQVGQGGTLVRQVTILVPNPGAISEQSSGTATIGTASCASSGTFTYAAQKQVVAKTTGELASLAVKEGDRVSKHQILGLFDETDMETQIENASISLQNAQLALETAENRLKDYTITAPIAGTVIEKNYKVGDNLDPATAANSGGVTYAAMIYDMSTLTFVMNIDERDVNQIQVGQVVEITAAALEGQQFTGHVDKININGTTLNGRTTYPVTVLVDTAQALKPGMNVSAKILMEQVKDVLCIPVETVGQGGTVLVALPGALDDKGSVIDPTKIETRTVTLGRNNDAFIEITQGLEEGDIVLTENVSSNMMAAMMGG